MKKDMRFRVKTACFAVGLAACAITAQGDVLRVERVIEDPHSGKRWVLRKDPQHPGGPGRLVEEAAGAAGKASEAQTAPWVIRAGDRVLVEERTRVARGLFEAVALGAARQGASFRVRLRVGGRVVRAIAVGPGRAMLAGSDEVEQ